MNDAVKQLLAATGLSEEDFVYADVLATEAASNFIYEKLRSKYVVVSLVQVDALIRAYWKARGAT